jgi:RecG-like helicase
LIPEAKQKAYIKDILAGKIQLIIGTHRLLSKDIVYRDLGLLIVDEEQRFGVEQKEKIKEIRTNVDVLTLSATPIPRTLQISLLGIRQLSQINTSPLNRVPIQTYVMRHDPLVVKELIERELAREGQVYYLHNRVDDIYYSEAENRIKALLTVVDNPLPFLVVFGAVVGGIAALMLMFGVQLEKVEKVMSDPVMADTIQTGGLIVSGVIALAIIIGLKTLFK